MEQDQQKSGKGEKITVIGELPMPPLTSGGIPTPADISIFQDRIYRYYADNGRDFPWRSTTDPYKILVSEMMLQQTQASRVLPKYEQFVTCFPDLPSLAEASLAEIFSLWQGLGYNRRARALQEIARRCMKEYGGQLPVTQEELRSLPMVGPATSAALLAFAWNRPSLYLETNIRRVLIFMFFSGTGEVHDRQLYELLDMVLDRENPRKWYYALMDYGVFLKTAVPNPNRRSAHYTRQAKFENSNRQVRGSILLVLNEKGPSKLGELIGLLSFPRERILKALVQLEHEELVEIQRSSFASDEVAEKVQCCCGYQDGFRISIPRR